MIRTFDELLNVVQKRQPDRVAIAAAGDVEALEALKEASDSGLATGILIGDPGEIGRCADLVGLDLSDQELVSERDPEAAARLAVQAVRSGQANVLMKGRLQTADLLRAALDRERGLRTGRPLSHVAVMELKDEHRLILVTDGGVNIAPDVARKAQIIDNAVVVAHKLGMTLPRVAVLAAVEVINPEMPATIDAAMLAKMADRRQIRNAIVDGPLALDVAISREAAEHKGLTSPVGGQADILVAPNIEAGNILVKSLQYFAGATMAGVVVGAQVPIVVLSRADRAESKLLSIALAKYLVEPNDGLTGRG
ncbi:MAG: bifunctional enoyl-CoA hydratase/phosphate acetyltransferase [Bacillota bacterium]